MDRGDSATPSALIGGKRILLDCLRIREGEHVAVFWDSTTGAVAQVFREVANQLNIAIEDCNVPFDVEFGFRPNDALPTAYLQALSRARVTISCLSDDPRGTNFRKAIIEQGLRSADSRLAHMPGATIELLEDGAAVELAEAEDMCDYLGAVLSLGEHAVLETYELGPDGQPLSKPGQSHRLTMDLGGMNRMPIMSPGVITPGTWGNVPGGETFIAPIEATANGTFVLNGAFTGHVLSPPSRLVLRFSAGHLTDVSGESVAKEKFEALLTAAENDGDEHCRDLAELGIGVNRGIRRLIGRSLSDEKMYGTIHIALGDSKRFGGYYESAVHEDVVTMRPSLWVDDSPIVVRGRLVFDRDKWQDRLDGGSGGTPQSACDAPATHWVNRTAISATTTEQGLLRVDQEIGSQRNRRCTYTVGEPRASRILSRLYALIPEVMEPVLLEKLVSDAAKQDLDEPTVRYALRILARHQLAEIKEN